MDAITTNSILLSHARIRVQPRAGRWRPYVDALLGLNYLSTSTTIGGRDQFISGGTTLGDVGLSYGGGAGVTVGFGTPPRGTRLDLSLRFIGGPEADYLPEGAIRREDGQAILDISRSRTDMVVLYIGASWASR